MYGVLRRGRAFESAGTLLRVCEELDVGVMAEEHGL